MDIKIKMHSTWWKTPPSVLISVGGIEYFNDSIADDITVNFSHDTTDESLVELVICLQGKDDSHTVLENGIIVKDQLLHIDGIEIDNIDLGNLLYQAKYKPIYPPQWIKEQQSMNQHVPDVIENVDTLGHNGSWTMTFTLPFHIWYLENLP